MFDRSSRRVGPVLALVAAVLAGCSSELSLTYKPPPPPDPRQFPARYKTEIADFMRTYLNNPTKVKDAFIAEPVIKNLNGLEQYITCVRYNPRDDRDRYEGSTTKLAVFLGNRLNQFLEGKPEMCAGLAYTRYPEIENMVP